MKSVLIVAIAFGIGLVAALFLNTSSLNFNNLNTNTLWQELTTKAQSIINTWNAIPQAFQGIILAGIPTAFMMFFAWTKTRAMQQLQQTQQQATSTISQLTGEAIETQSQLDTLKSQVTSQTETIKSLEQQLANSPTQQALLEWKTAYDKLQNDYNVMERTYQNALQELKQKQVQVVK